MNVCICVVGFFWTLVFMFWQRGISGVCVGETPVDSYVFWSRSFESKGTNAASTVKGWSEENDTEILRSTELLYGRRRNQKILLTVCHGICEVSINRLDVILFLDSK